MKCREISFCGCRSKNTQGAAQSWLGWTAGKTGSPGQPVTPPRLPLSPAGQSLIHPPKHKSSPHRQSTSLLPTFNLTSSSSARRGGKECDVTVTAANWRALVASSPNPIKLQWSLIQIFIRKISEKQQTENYRVLLWKPFYYKTRG